MPIQPAGKIRLNSGKRVPNLLMRVWDAPTRLFHWAIVALIVVSYVSIRRNAMDLHYYAGYALAALLLFRLVWGFVGSETSRFSHFLRNPVSAFMHLAHFARRGPDTEIGHNAAGGWMVLAMLLALAVQVGTGLFGQDTENFVEGPLAHHLSVQTGEQLVRIHGFNFYYVILVLVGLHVLAVLAYALVKRHDLVRPMVTGRKRLPGTMHQPRFASPALALAIFAACAALVWAVVRYG